MDWIQDAIRLLKRSLYPVPTELNALDWKSELSPKKEKLARHLSAFANLQGGGYLVYGINNDASLSSVTKDQAEDIVRQISNIAREGVSPSVGIEHSIESFEGHSLLFIHIKESREKPVQLRGHSVNDSFIRSGNQTVRMSPQEIRQTIAESSGILFDEQIAADSLTADQVLNMLDYDSYFRLIKRNLPDGKSAIMDVLAQENFIVPKNGMWAITNFGALMFARDMTQFRDLEYKALRIIFYKGKNRINAYTEQPYNEGYACGFEHFIQSIMGRTSVEVIEHAHRERNDQYPERSIREFTANMLTHQNLWQSGMFNMIEIFSDRIEMTNPGTPLVDVNRFIDAPPKSRNEKIAIMMRRFEICELRGSGVDRAIEAIEKVYLPAPKFIKGDNYTKVVLYPKMTFSQMSKEDRIRACYQHCCLRYLDNDVMTNQSLRERLEISSQNYPTVSKIIKDTLSAGFIKDSTPESKSRKYASYIPYWG